MILEMPVVLDGRKQIARREETGVNADCVVDKNARVRIDAGI